MKNILVVIAVFLGLGFVGFLWYSGKYDTMVAKEELVSKSWADVEAQYQRRADLIPNLVNTVKGYAEHEKETLTGVVEARSKATSVNIDPSKMTSADLQRFNSAQSGLGSALSKLMVVVEKYPDLKANQNFMQLQAQLEGTENRISVSRQRFNEASRDFNTYIKGFINKRIASGEGFEPKPYFEAKDGSDEAPDVNF